MLPVLPVELLIIIYDYADTETRIKMNRAFKWSYYFKNPYDNVSIKEKINFKTLVMGTNFHKFASFKGATFVIPY